MWLSSRHTAEKPLPRSNHSALCSRVPSSNRLAQRYDTVVMDGVAGRHRERRNRRSHRLDAVAARGERGCPNPRTRSASVRPEMANAALAQASGAS
jgi:hypothetical protein